MADARALLRAKRQDSAARVTHPYASYTSMGQLRCSACSVPIKSSAMWEGHVGSKAHRVAVRNLKAREGVERERGARRAGKRKAEAVGEGQDDMNVDESAHASGAIAKKRKASVEPDEAHPSPAASMKPTGLPADFFSDPSRAPILSTADEDEEEGDNPEPVQPVRPPASNQPKSQIDLEFEQFQASILATTSAEEGREEERRATFQRATVAAEPELVTTNTDGFPPEVAGAEVDEVEEKREETEEEKQRRKEEEERELIMDRLVEEERAQEEADERVGLLKARVEALKKAREGKRKVK